MASYSLIKFVKKLILILFFILIYFIYYLFIYYFYLIYFNLCTHSAINTSNVTNNM